MADLTQPDPAMSEVSTALDTEMSDTATEIGRTTYQTLNAWYSRLRPLVLDLVGDYAGQELFIVEGDSLLLHVLSDPRIDMAGGPQVLHAIYMVELFLHNLKSRGSNFHVVFFDEHRPLVFPNVNNSPVDFWKFDLIRSCAIRHLSDANSRDSTNARLLKFTGPSSPEFKMYLAAERPYFVMCHDGASEPRIPGGRVKTDERLQASAKWVLRGFIWQMMSRGYNCALLHESTFRDSKIMTMVLEGQKMNLFQEGFGIKLDQDIVEALGHIIEIEGTTLDDTILPTSMDDTTRLSEREHISFEALRLLASENEASSHLVQEFGYFYLLHLSALKSWTLEQRHTPTLTFDDSEHFKNTDFDQFVRRICYMLSHVIKLSEISTSPSLTYDILDGRLLRYLMLKYSNTSFDDLPSTMKSEISRLVSAYEASSGTTLNKAIEGFTASTVGSKPTPAKFQASAQVLPFQSEVFEQQLKSVQLPTESIDIEHEKETYLPSPELIHWRSNKVLHKPKQLTFWQAKGVQRYESQMIRYAASLTGRVGNDIDPQLIVVDPKGGAKPAKAPQAQAGPSGTSGKADKKSGKAVKEEKETKGKAGSKKGKEPVVRKADLMKIEGEKKLAEKNNLQTGKAWTSFRRTLERDKEDRDTVLVKIAEYQKKKVSQSVVPLVYLETQVYRLQTLVNVWINLCRNNKQEQHYGVAALVFDEARNIVRSPALTKPILKLVDSVFKDILGFPAIKPDTEPTDDTKLSFEWAGKSYEKSKIPMTSTDFQLRFSGPLMDRNMGSRPDPRVPFEPDTWQREVLDELDQKNSVFVVAPTSAGKTFISFYAMEQALRANNDDVLVYVAPTKALVNQIAAEVLGRFKKTYPHAGKSVWAIHTRDYQIHESTGCQILITVPHILQILLLKPTNAKVWAPKVKRIIFDEIHSIGQAEDGIVWEQLLLLAPCPIIALSATVGNPDEFRDWLVATQKSQGTKLSMIEHKHRYSDLRKFNFTPPESFKFTGLERKDNYGELEEDTAFTPIHPMASLVDAGSRGMPSDLALEPRDCLKLYQTMLKHQTPNFSVPDALKPEKWFGPVIKKENVVAWEVALKETALKWMASDSSPFKTVVEDLSSNFVVSDTPGGSMAMSNLAEALAEEEEQEEYLDDEGTESESGSAIADEKFEMEDDHDTDESVQRTTLPMLYKLHSQNALPAILFSHDRTLCDKVCNEVLNQLVSAEKVWRKESPVWAKKMKQYEEYAKMKNKPQKEIKKVKLGNKEDQEDTTQDEQYAEASSMANFRPDDPDERFSFAGKINHEIDEDLKILRDAQVPAMYISALQRGIGVHHGGLSRKLRECVERLFRLGFLRVVIATGTLALGVNMPCTTVCFIGDTVNLTALNYRQAAGRAGRRGFDLLGNVVFHGITEEKVKRLMSSKLPSLIGHFPISTSLVLRLFTLLAGSDNSPYSEKAVTNLLSQSRLYLGGSSFKEQVLHHLRFSIEYLRRQHLIDTTGTPVEFAAFTTNLYFTENSAFAFHALFQAGYFKDVCENIYTNPKRTGEALMLILSHLFGRRAIRKADIEYKEEIMKRSSSQVYLPPIPKKALAIIKNHNQETLEIFKTYVTTFAKQYCQDSPDNLLPYTKIAVGLTSPSSDDASSATIHARSGFVALSGHTDDFTSVSDLAETVRAGVFLEEDAVPIVEIGDEFSTTQYNAYLLDFYKNGAMQPLVNANGLRGNDVWDHLNDFLLVLATITASLANYLGDKSGDGEDEDVAMLLTKEEGDTDGFIESAVNEREEMDALFKDRSGATGEEGDAALKRVLLGFRYVKSEFETKLTAVGATKKVFKKRNKKNLPSLKKR